MILVSLILELSILAGLLLIEARGVPPDLRLAGCGPDLLLVAAIVRSSRPAARTGPLPAALLGGLRDLLSGAAPKGLHAAAYALAGLIARPLATHRPGLPILILASGAAALLVHTAIGLALDVPVRRTLAVAVTTLAASPVAIVPLLALEAATLPSQKRVELSRVVGPPRERKNPVMPP